MNNNFRLLLFLVTLLLVLLISGFSFILVNQHITTKEEEPWGWCGTPDPPDNPTYDLGEALFKVNCASCHNKNMNVDMTGPALGGVLERWNGDTMRLTNFIRNTQAYIATTSDPYATTLCNEWESVMQNFPNLTDEEIKAIIEYTESYYVYQLMY